MIIRPFSGRSRPFFTRLLIIGLVITIIAAVAPSSSALAQKCKFKHEVEPGDTLIYLGTLYQIDWRDIADSNNVKEPYVLVEGTVLCIPGGVSPGTQPTTTEEEGGPKFWVVPSVGHVLVSVENFPKKISYYVRIFPRSAGVAYRIGHFTTNKEGDYTGWFNVPFFVPRLADMAVCIKNVWTDAVSCAKYEDPYIPLIQTIRRTCKKNGK